jgi:hypothetical protein
MANRSITNVDTPLDVALFAGHDFVNRTSAVMVVNWSAANRTVDRLLFHRDIKNEGRFLHPSNLSSLHNITEKTDKTDKFKKFH